MGARNWELKVFHVSGRNPNTGSTLLLSFRVCIKRNLKGFRNQRQETNLDTLIWYMGTLTATLNAYS